MKRDKDFDAETEVERIAELRRKTRGKGLSYTILFITRGKYTSKRGKSMTKLKQYS